MAWAPLLLSLLAHCTAAHMCVSQPEQTVLGLRGRLPGRPGRGGHSYYISWYQQKPGSRPRYLLQYKSDSEKHQGSGVPSRFSGSKDASANAGLLTISGLQPEDEAHYYCLTYHSGYNHSDSDPRGSETKTSRASTLGLPSPAPPGGALCCLLLKGLC
ncbi:unnamed protein product [Pipistrellus nathusii]|uniref:Ig-like domain-containing protein n=1 Tax=Pipistrellus nathusii TaxID=59473 RepID=A0ABN9ZSZ3_PIPNA